MGTETDRRPAGAGGQVDVGDVILEVLTSAILKRHSLPDDSATHAEVKQWVRGALGDSWWDLLYDIYNVVEGLPQRLINLATDISNVPSSVVKDLQSYLVPNAFLQTLEGDLKQAVTANWSSIEANLRTGFRELTQHISLIGQFAQAFKYYGTRFNYVKNSFEDLAKILGKNPPEAALMQALERLITCKDAAGAEQALVDLMKLVVVDSNPIFRLAEAVLHSGFSGVWSNIFPCPVAPGDLNLWINPKPSVEAAEREFRKELVAAVDHYCRGKFGSGEAKGVLRAADDRLALQLLADFISVILSTTFGFILRRPTLPSPTLPKLAWAFPFQQAVRADDVANEVSIALSRQLGYQAKAGAGLLLRGFWDVSTMNNSLVEGLASLAGNTFSGLLEAFLHDLFWSVEIHEAYPDDTKSDNFVWAWDTEETINGAPSNTLQYRVFVRSSVVAQAEAEILTKLITNPASETLRKLLTDYGAYMDAIRDYRPDDARAEVTTDAVTITSVSLDGSGKAVIEADSGYPADFPSPPVLRAYCAGECIVMQKIATAPGASRYRVNFDRLQSGSMLYIRSNYGDMSTQIVNPASAIDPAVRS